MTPSRLAILQERYFHPHEGTDDEMHRRVAHHWAPVGYEDAVYRMMASGDGLPNSPAIANAGLESAMGSACFVLPVEDSSDSILDTFRDACLVQKSGGGTGFDFSAIRPRGALVKGTGRRAPGLVQVPLKLYSTGIDCWTQAGMRKGANLASVSVYHPDVVDFITAKDDESSVTNFNLSVMVDDRFMRAVATSYGGEEVLPCGLAMRDVWALIIMRAHYNGEPGLLFFNAINDHRLHPEFIYTTNPCGEVPLRPYEACVLGSVNLANHTTGGGFDWPRLEHTTRVMVRLLDSIIDRQVYPLEKIAAEHRRYRKVGVGVMGLADALVDLGYPYDHPAAAPLAEQVARRMQSWTYDESAMMAAELGPYPAFYEEHRDSGRPRYGLSGKSMTARGYDLPYRRNLCTMAIAPTGTIARIAGCSFGLEPHFAEHRLSRILGSVFDDGRDPRADLPAFRTYHQVALRSHLDIASAFQRWTDQGASKTINLPDTASPKDVEELFTVAWRRGLKGVTVLVDGSREDVVIAGVCEGTSCVV